MFLVLSSVAPPPSSIWYGTLVYVCVHDYTCIYVYMFYMFYVLSCICFLLEPIELSIMWMQHISRLLQNWGSAQFLKPKPCVPQFPSQSADLLEHLRL